ncbi:GDYXXLXY domain-containing protein [Aquamicrobium zhengzhouense]|uniref:GDYXXLXY domain-containing protein n=1 Tax=Aquamicrobium zhengzhouense TaxID=2781738 RepID=A0ABS0SB09_9HYPH|nr:GDYXXLXY domain-containing protein [Aquamicrobium zhengzhouense]MBI1620478.1 GDYXXLXY domain-containing protein [Aquamicrobium zhengzhouense]
MTRRWLIILAFLVAAAQISVLSWTILGRASILRDGSEIVLSVEPVDPRDLLRGDYVTLAYNISDIPLELFSDLANGGSTVAETVYVRLRPGGEGIWAPIAASVGAPLSNPPLADEVDIRGHARVNVHSRQETVRVRYGIERYYVPEGEGREIERNLGLGSFTVRVAVAADGASQIKSLHDGDRMLYQEPLY